MQTGSRTGVQYLSADGSDSPIAVVTSSDSIGAWIDTYALEILPAATYASIPAAGTYGRVFHPTDVGREGEYYFDTGSVWRQISPTPPTDPIAGTPGLRTLGAGAQQAASGTHTHAATALAVSGTPSAATFLRGDNTWAPLGLPSGMLWDVHYQGGVATGPLSTSLTYFSAAGLYLCGFGGYIYSSPDGITWTQRSSATGCPQTFNAIACSGSMAVAVPGVASSTTALSSPDGITWTARTLPSSHTWSHVAYGGGIFVAVPTDAGANVCATSPDGITWTQRTLPSVASSVWSGLGYGNGVFMINSSSGTNATYTSPDGITWTAVGTIATTLGSGVADLACSTATGTWIASMRNGSGSSWVRSTNNGTSWGYTQQMYSVSYIGCGLAYGNGMFLSVVSQMFTSSSGAAPAGILRSVDDGVSLGVHALPIAPGTAGPLVYGTKWVGLPSSGTIITAP